MTASHVGERPGPQSVEGPERGSREARASLALKLVAAAYIVFVALILIYVSIMARKLTRTQRELRELKRNLEVKEDLEPNVQETPRSERAQERIA